MPSNLESSVDASPVPSPRRRPARPSVCARELAEVLDRALAYGHSMDGLALRIAERHGLKACSVERRLRHIRARRSGLVGIATADRVLTEVGLHLIDLPGYRAALIAEHHSTAPGPPVEEASQLAVT